MIAAIENAILARLKAAADAGVLGYRWRTLESYPENWDEHLKDKLAPVAPAAWVVFAGWGQSDPDAATLRLPATFGVVVMAQNTRNETATRHGGPDIATEVGVYQLAEDATGLLSGSDLGLDIDSIEVGACRWVRPPAALAERKCAMLAIELRTAFAIAEMDVIGDGLGGFEAFHVDWDVPPFRLPVPIDDDPGTPGVQLPDDAHADAVDHVELETLP